MPGSASGSGSRRILEWDVKFDPLVVIELESPDRHTESGFPERSYVPARFAGYEGHRPTPSPHP